MKLKIAIVAAAALSVFALPAVQAATRAEAKASDAASNSPKTPSGQLSTSGQDKGPTAKSSVESRESVKSQATAAEAAGSIPKGQQSVAGQGKKPSKPHTENSRADVKADTASAVKAGTIPKGQSSQKDQDKGVTKP